MALTVKIERNRQLLLQQLPLLQQQQLQLQLQQQQQQQQQLLLLLQQQQLQLQLFNAPIYLLGLQMLNYYAYYGQHCRNWKAA